MFTDEVAYDREFYKTGFGQWSTYQPFDDNWSPNIEPLAKKAWPRFKLYSYILKVWPKFWLTKYKTLRSIRTFNNKINRTIDIWKGY